MLTQENLKWYEKNKKYMSEAGMSLLFRQVTCPVLCFIIRSMKIIALMENTLGDERCTALHGLSFYIESERHKILFDSGPSDETLNNAQKLGVDLKCVDTAVLSHGHYDHSGGLLAFAALNSRAKIYMQKDAGGENYAFDGPEKGYRYIGIDKKILGLPQLELIQGDLQIDEELFLFTIDRRTFAVPGTNRRIVRKCTGRETYVQDDFSHEHCLFIKGKSPEASALISGCAHNGILNIMEEFIRKFGKASLPKTVISGFHLMKKNGYEESDLEEERFIARKLMDYPCKFITCHCTGEEPYENMKKIMGDRLNYIRTGNIGNAES